MRGYSIADIAARANKTRQSYEVLFRRAVRKICRRNDQAWIDTYGIIKKEPPSDWDGSSNADTQE